MVLHRFTAEPLFAREFAVLARERAIGLVPLPGRRRGPDSWLGDGVGPTDDLTALLARVPDIAERDVYVCGPAALDRPRPPHPRARPAPRRPRPHRELRMVT